MRLITVTNIDPPVLKVVVVDVRDVCDICDVCIGDIHLVKIAAAYAIPRDEWFTKAQRAPAKASAETNPHTESPAKPRD
jgi:hypothetical protein